MELRFVRTDPVQQVAAEPGTLDLLMDSLRSKADEPRADPQLLDAARLTGWPLVYDDTLKPGIVHCRPTPGAPPPVSAAQIAEWMRALKPSEETPVPDLTAHKVPALVPACDGHRHHNHPGLTCEEADDQIAQDQAWLDRLARHTVVTPMSEVPPALRGPNWKA